MSPPATVNGDGPNGHTSPVGPSPPPPPRTTAVKVCIIGDSGVGKSSLRTRYLTKRFSQSYKATIGCDFVTHGIPMTEDETVSLAIWDTAGQERFASLSSAFFRGSDAAIFVYDRTKPDTLKSIRRWFGEFVDSCPVEGIESKRRFCFAVVGNKADKLAEDEEVVSEEDVRALMDELIPPRPPPPPPPPPPTASASESKPLPGSTSFSSLAAATSSRLRTLSTSVKPARSSSPAPSSRSTITVHHQPQSIEINPTSHNPTTSTSRRESPSGTLANTFTPTLYHTPSSSFFEAYGTHLEDRDPPPPQSQRGSSPQRTAGGAASSMYSFNIARSTLTTTSSTSTSTNGTAVPFPTLGSSEPPTSAGAAAAHRRNRSISANRSLSSTSATGSTVTLRPPKMSNSSTLSSTNGTGPMLPPPLPPLPPTPPPQVGASAAPDLGPPEEQPKIFPRVSAKTGEGVDEVFGYVARRVWERWAWEERSGGWGGELEMDAVDVGQKGKEGKKGCGC